jgi:hypothetical protein
MNKEDPWKIVRSLSYRILDLGSLWGHADPYTLLLSEHQLCPLQACISPNLYPPILASLHYFPLSFTACLGPCLRFLSHIPPFSAYNILTTFPVSSYTSTNKILFRDILVILVTYTYYWFASYLFCTYFLLGLFLTLNMEVTCSSETSADFQRTIWRYIPKDRALHNHHSENLKSYTAVCYKKKTNYQYEL